MSKTISCYVDVQFGDCDPAEIVFFPNFSRWMDAASHHYFVQCGLPPWRAMTELPGCVGAPMLEIQTRFVNSATHGERIVHQGAKRPPEGHSGARLHSLRLRLRPLAFVS